MSVLTAYSGMAHRLQEGLASLAITLTLEQQERLLLYLRLMQKWNKTYNLTAITEDKQMVTRHLLDSLVVLPFMTADRILDVGTGAGLPGVPLAISLPQKHFTLLDCTQKKMNFLQQAKIELALENVTLVTSRVENYFPKEKFPVLISRAFCSMTKMLPIAEHLLMPGGTLVCMQGKLVTEQLTLLGQSWHIDGAFRLIVPELNEERHAVIIKRGE